MAAKRVVVTDYIEQDLEWEKGELASHGLELLAYQLKGRPEAEIAESCRDAGALVVNMVKITESLLARLPACRLIIRHGIGYDNVDVGACTRHSIQFAYEPDYCADDVAEHAIALIFACARKVPRSRAILERSSAKGQWDFSGLFPIYRMEGKTLGIVGTGRIGSRVCRRLGSFGFRMLGCDPYLSEERRREIGCTFVDLPTLLRQADFVTLHTPLNDETRRLIDSRALALMKSTAYLINTARGPIVEWPALVAALREGRLAGAAVDVFDTEPPPPDDPLFGFENVILTPHTGWASEESGQTIRRNILEDLKAFAAGRDARYVVNGVKLRT